MMIDFTALRPPKRENEYILPRLIHDFNTNYLLALYVKCPDVTIADTNTDGYLEVIHDELQTTFPYRSELFISRDDV